MYFILHNQHIFRTSAKCSKYTKFEKSVLALGECTYKFEKVCLLWLSMFITEKMCLLWVSVFIRLKIVCLLWVSVFILQNLYDLSCCFENQYKIDSCLKEKNNNNFSNFKNSTTILKIIRCLQR